MNTHAQTSFKDSSAGHLLTPGTSNPFQRKCACGAGSSSLAGGCDSCKENENLLQRKPGDHYPAEQSISPIVHEVLSSPGQPLDRGARAFFEPRFGHDFSKVRVHTGARAAESALAVNALAYTVGNNVVFGAGQYAPQATSGRRVLAHELTHVVQQEGSVDGLTTGSQLPHVKSLGEGGHKLRVASTVDPEDDVYEREADAVAERVSEPSEKHGPVAIGTNLARQRISRKKISLQRLKLPEPMPICGATVTDIYVLPARPRPLTECGLPPTLMVTRVNILGHQVTSGSTGKGKIIFNLHVGYYRDPATGRLCAVISDSKKCLTPGGCMHLGCFPTLEEVLEAIWEGFKTVLKVIGIIILAIIAALLLRGLRNMPGESPGFSPSPVLAGGPGEGSATGEEGTAEA